MESNVFREKFEEEIKDAQDVLEVMNAWRKQETVLLIAGKEAKEEKNLRRIADLRDDLKLSLFRAIDVWIDCDPDL